MEQWWLNNHYWNADMEKVMNSHFDFIERQRTKTQNSFMGLEIVTDEGIYHPYYGSSTSVVADSLLRVATPGMRVLEIGTGSGALACFLASNGCYVVAIDVDEKAVACANENVKTNGLDDRVTVRHSDLFSNIGQDEKFDLIVFNPPLLHCEPMAEKKGMEPRYDNIAIDHNGEVLLEYATEAKKHIKPGGHIVTLVSNIGNKEVIEEFSKSLTAMDVLYAQYRKSGNQWRFVLAATHQGDN